MSKVIEITYKDSKLILTLKRELDDTRKSAPNLSQEYSEKMVLELHEKVKKNTSYLGVFLGLGSIDYYDEGYDHYTVAGASIRKGERKVRNDSWTKTSIPKGWELNIQVVFNGNKKPTKAITETLGAMAVRLTEKDFKAMQKLLKANNQAYVNIEETNHTSMHTWHTTTTTTITISDVDDRW